MPAATGDGIDLSKIRELEERLSKFRIDTSPDMTIRGNAWQGFALNTYTCDELSEAQGGGGGIVPESGACCIDPDCSITTAVACNLLGGIYQGDGITCDPNPCGTPVTGACCKDGMCSILSEADCVSSGGVYQGDGTNCATNCCTHYGTCCHCKPCPGFGDCDFIDYPGECDTNTLDADCGCPFPDPMNPCICGTSRLCDWTFNVGVHTCFGFGGQCNCFSNSIDECPPP